MMTGFSDDEHRFTREAEIALLKVLGAWNALGAHIDIEKRLVIEASLLMKLLIMIARDGLKMRDGVMLAATLADMWRDEDEGGDDVVLDID